MPSRDKDRTEQQPMSRRTSDVSSNLARNRMAGSSRGLDPFNQFRRLTDQMERWFDAVSGTRSVDRPGGMNLWAPEIETFIRDDKFVVRADLPGLNKEEVNVEVNDDIIALSGERQQTHEEEREGFYRTERSYGRFYREIPLPEGALPETAQANYRDGVLEITVTTPPREVTKPRRIEISGASTSDTNRSGTTTQSRERSVAQERPPRGLDIE